MGLVEIAQNFGIGKDEMLELANIPLGKLSTAVGAQFAKKDRKRISKEFVDACLEADIVTVSKARHTLA